MKHSARFCIPMFLLTAISSSQLVLAQQDQSRADQPRMRQMLQQRLDKIHQQEQQLEDALAQLDAGADPQDLREQFQSFDRQARGQGAQHDRQPGSRVGIDQPNRARPHATDQELIDVLRLLDSPRADRIADALERNPQRARMMLVRMAPRLRELVRLQKENPDAFEPRVEMHKASRDAFRAARRLYHLTQGGAGPADIEASKAQVLDAIRRRVDAEIEFRQAMLSSFTHRLDAMRDEVGNLRASRQERIIEQMEHLLNRIANGKLPDAAALEGSPPRDRRPQR